MKEFLHAIYEYPWTFMYLCLGVKIATSTLKVTIGDRFK